jgi:hypothetical protein
MEIIWQQIWTTGRGAPEPPNQIMLLTAMSHLLYAAMHYSGVRSLALSRDMADYKRRSRMCHFELTVQGNQKQTARNPDIAATNRIWIGHRVLFPQSRFVDVQPPRI